MKLKNRITKLEGKRRGGGTPEIIALHFDNGKVTKVYNGDKHHELIGKTSADIDRLYSGRSDALVIKVVRASQGTRRTQGGRVLETTGTEERRRQKIKLPR